MASTDVATSKNEYHSGSIEWLGQFKKNTTIHALADETIIGIKNYEKKNGIDNPNLWINGNGKSDVTINYAGSIHGIDLEFRTSGHTRDGRDYYWYSSGGYDKGSKGPDSLDVWIRDISVLDATSSDDKIDMRDLNDASLGFDAVMADEGDDLVYGSDFADVIFGEKGNDTVYAGAGNDYVSMGAINAGYQEEVWLGEGNDILSLAALGEDFGTDSFDTGQSFLTNLAEEGLNAALDVGMFAATSSGVGFGAKLGIVAAMNVVKSGSGLFADWLGHNMENAGDGDYDNDESSFVKLMDGNLAEDIIILPLLDFDTIETGEAIGNYTKTLKLDAENGGKFLEFTFDSDILADAEANFGVTDTATGDFFDSLWEHYAHSIVTFAKDDNGDVSIHTGTTIDGNENVATADDYGDEFDDLIAEVSGQLQNGTQISVMGNAFGLDADMTNSTRFAMGTNTSDQFQMGERANLDGEFMAMGLDGNDVFIVDQANAFYLVDGGDGTDIINFSNMQEGSTGTVSQGIEIDLDAETLDTGYEGSYSNQIKNIEAVVGTDEADVIKGSDSNNTIHGGDGNDTISSHGGNNTIDAGDGIDQIFGGNGKDRIDGGDDLDFLSGGGENDILFGGEGNDWLFGGEGHDTLTGGNGDDLLYGNEDADMFQFSSDETGHDTVSGFDAEDTLFITDANGSGLNITYEQHYRGNGDENGVTITYDNDFGGTNSIHVSHASLSDVEDRVVEYVETVICTHMHKLGYISDDVFKWDGYYGAHVLGETVIRGYHTWAIPFVRNVLEKSDLATRLVAPLAQGWALEMAHRCDPENHPQGSVVGKTILTLGVPLCWAIGSINGRAQAAA